MLRNGNINLFRSNLNSHQLGRMMCPRCIVSLMVCSTPRIRLIPSHWSLLSCCNEHTKQGCWYSSSRNHGVPWLLPTCSKRKRSQLFCLSIARAKLPLREKRNCPEQSFYRNEIMIMDYKFQLHPLDGLISTITQMVP
jgi:hypothetical protein